MCVTVHHALDNLLGELSIEKNYRKNYHIDTPLERCTSNEHYNGFQRFTQLKKLFKWYTEKKSYRKKIA